jgi:hypothetical protein
VPCGSLASANASFREEIAIPDRCLSLTPLAFFHRDFDVCRVTLTFMPQGHFVDLLITEQQQPMKVWTPLLTTKLPSISLCYSPYKLNPPKDQSGGVIVLPSDIPMTPRALTTRSSPGKLCGLSLSSRPSSASLLRAARGASMTVDYEAQLRLSPCPTDINLYFLPLTKTMQIITCNRYLYISKLKHTTV